MPPEKIASSLKNANNPYKYTWIVKNKIFLAFILFGTLIYYYNMSATYHSANIEQETFATDNLHVMGYLVYSEYCKIPNIYPFEQNIMRLFNPTKYKPCSNGPLTFVEYDTEKQLYWLRVIKDRLKYFSKSEPIDCCYQTISRNKEIDKRAFLSPECYSFVNETLLLPTIDWITVKCATNTRTVYHYGHEMIPERSSVRERLDKWKSKDIANQRKARNVVMIGIDSMSRLNLMRLMPKTTDYLYKNGWFELSGYNKVADNTFPNLMAVLTGYKRETVERKCIDKHSKHLDNCSAIIWNAFREHGYVTAYAEDTTLISSFNLETTGFIHDPVDYYQRPFQAVIEKEIFENRKRHCVGYQYQSDFIFDYAQEFAKRFANDSYFGLFWMNSFSHDGIYDSFSMDEHVVERLSNFMALLNNTIVIFFSDHGLRYGSILKTLTGYYEERLPFMFISLPTDMKKSHPEFVNALSINKNRLTNPFDLHMTLKHMLALSERVTDAAKFLAKAEDCPRCQTLFEAVPFNRSCNEIGIVDHWCTCVAYQRINPISNIVIEVVKLTIEHMNKQMKSFIQKKRCIPLGLRKMDKAYHATLWSKQKGHDVDVYRLQFYTKPNKGIYSSTAYYNATNGDFEVIGAISRLDKYAKDADCLSNYREEMKYCACYSKYETNLQHMNSNKLI